MKTLRALGFLLLSSGCAPDDSCASLCAHAHSKFASCLEERDAEWGTSVGFSSAADFDDWCSTFVWEERELGTSASGELTCADRQAIIDDGDCSAWYTAWGEAP